MLKEIIEFQIPSSDPASTFTCPVAVVQQETHKLVCTEGGLGGYPPLGSL